jgi:mRNA interferase RelE/StbE
MRYALEWSVAAGRQFRKLDTFTQRIIGNWLSEHVDGASDPRQHGKLLRGDKWGFWRYRIGQYRVICRIDDNALVVLAIRVGHRRDVYS